MVIIPYFFAYNSRVIQVPTFKMDGCRLYKGTGYADPFIPSTASPQGPGGPGCAAAAVGARTSWAVPLMLQGRGRAGLRRCHGGWGTGWQRKQAGGPQQGLALLLLLAQGCCHCHRSHHLPGHVMDAS